MKLKWGKWERKRGIPGALKPVFSWHRKLWCAECGNAVIKLDVYTRGQIVWRMSLHSRPRKTELAKTAHAAKLAATRAAKKWIEEAGG